MSAKKGEQSWFEERDARREAGGAPPAGDEQLVDPMSDERPIGQQTDDRQIGQYSDHGSPPLQKK